MTRTTTREGTKSARVFISYRREDGESDARLIHDALASKLGGDEVFFDREAIDYGEPWPDRLRDAVDAAAVVLVVIGKNWVRCADDDGWSRLENETDWVRVEIETALDRDGVVIPVLVQGAVMPRRFPGSLGRLRQHQAITIRGDHFRANVDALVDRVATILGGTAGLGPALAVLIARYQGQVATKHEDVALAGFETRVRVPIKLEDLHVPLRAAIDLHGCGPSRFVGLDGDGDDAEGRTERDIPLKDAFEAAAKYGDRRAVVIVGDPGSGKTTHLKRVLLSVIREGPASVGLPDGMVPVFLPLRDLCDTGLGLDAFIEQQLEGPFRDIPVGFGAQLVDRGNLLFLLDGLDEVADATARAEVSRWIEQAVEHYDDCRFLVTCRRAGYTDEARLKETFLELELRPLDDDQAKLFVRNWYRIVETTLADDEIEAEAKAREQADDLIAKLRSTDFRAARVSELTHNPMLLTTICLVHRDREGQLPDRRVRLYDECIKILLGTWREAKKLPSTVPAEQARGVLQPVALFLHEEEQRTHATVEELEPTIEQAFTEVRGETPSAQGFLEAIRDESGLLTGHAVDRYGFMHLGFQEYLAAREIRTRGVRDPAVLRALAERFGDSWWQEVTLMLLALDDPSAFGEFMEIVVEQPRFAEYGELVDLCLSDAARVSSAPFVSVLERAPGEDEALWRRQGAALRVLRRLDPQAVERMREDLARHPWPEVRHQFVETKRSAGREVIVADRGGYELVRIEGGTLLMGSTAEELESFAGDRGQYWKRLTQREQPVREVPLTSFFLGVRPVTNAEYERYMRSVAGVNEPEHWSDRRFNAPEQPVVGVSWAEAAAYCKWAGLALPTEAQWEYACRAGTRSSFWSGEGDAELSRVGWYRGNSDGRLHPVGEKPANEWGLHDMHGNMWEWCQDWNGSYEVPVRADDGLRAVESAESRVIRGGSWYYSAEFCRSACRGGYHPGNRWDDLGLRAARVIT